MTLTRALTVNQAAWRVGVTKQTIYAWIESGRLPIRRTVSGSIRIEEADLWQRTPEASEEKSTPSCAR